MICIIISLITAEGIRKAAFRPGQREPMGQRVARSASPETDPGGGVYMDAPNGLMSDLSKSDLLLLSYIIRRYNMPKGRPTNNPKGESIRIRITDDMRAKLERESFQTGLSISQIIRNLITQKLS